MSWVQFDGTLLPGHRFAPNNSHLTTEFIESVQTGLRSATVSDLSFRDPSQFVAGGLHNHPQAWASVASFLPTDQSNEVLDWIYNKVDVSKYFCHFKGGFKGEWYDTDVPPTRAFVYHTTGSLVSSYLRTIGIPYSLYIDDRHSSQIVFPATSPPPVVIACKSVDERNFTLAQIAIFLLCFTLMKLGYTIRLDKSILVPSQSVSFLGFLSDSLNQAFRLLPHKKEKFLLLIKDFLARN